MQFRSLPAIAALAAILVASALPTTAANPAPPASMLKPIQTALAAFNAGNPKMLRGIYASNVTIVDEYTPYVWSGADAGTAWVNDFGKFAKSIHLTSAKGTLLPVRIFNQSGNRAYVVAPLDFVAIINGKPSKEHGTWTFTLQRSGSSWLVVTQTWGVVSETM